MLFEVTEMERIRGDNAEKVKADLDQVIISKIGVDALNALNTVDSITRLAHRTDTMGRARYLPASAAHVIFDDIDSAVVGFSLVLCLGHMD